MPLVITRILPVLCLMALCQAYLLTGTPAGSQFHGVPKLMTASGRFWNSTSSSQTGDPLLSGTQAWSGSESTSASTQEGKTSLSGLSALSANIAPSRSGQSAVSVFSMATGTSARPSTRLSTGVVSSTEMTSQPVPTTTILTSIISSTPVIESVLFLPSGSSADPLITFAPDASATLALDQPEATSSVSALSSNLTGLFIPIQGWQKDPSSSDNVINAIRKTETFAATLLARLKKPRSSSGGCGGSLFAAISCAINDLHSLVKSITAEVQDEVEDIVKGLHELVDDIDKLEQITHTHMTTPTTVSESASTCSESTAYDVTVSCSTTMVASRPTTACQTSTRTSVGCSATGQTITSSASASSCSASTVSHCTSSCTFMDAGSTSSCSNICSTVSGCSVTGTTMTDNVGTTSLPPIERYYKPDKNETLDQEVSAMLYSMLSSQGLLIDDNSTSTQTAAASPGPASTTALLTTAQSTLMTMTSNTGTITSHSSDSTTASISQSASSTATSPTASSNVTTTAPPKCSRKT